MQKNKKYNNIISEKLYKILDNSSSNNFNIEDRNFVSLKDRLERSNKNDIFIKKVMVKKILDEKIDLKPKVIIHVREKEIITSPQLKIKVDDSIKMKKDAIFDDKEFFEVEKIKPEETNFIEVKNKKMTINDEDKFKEKEIVTGKILPEWEPIEMEKKEMPPIIKQNEEIVKSVEDKKPLVDEEIIEWETVNEETEKKIKEEFQEIEFKPEEETNILSEPTEKSLKQENILNIEQVQNIEFKLEPFKDIKSISRETAIILYDNGIKSEDEINQLTLKNLKKIKGIKRKIAKKIILEIKNKNIKKIQNISEKDTSDKFLIDKDKEISETKTEETTGYQFEGYTLFKKEFITKSGNTITMRFFSKTKHENAQPINLPEGYRVIVNKKTNVPYLKKENN